jgi:probable F420-dependent oxidoreductase
MDLGLTMFPTDYAIDVPSLARACEERGFESLFLPEHTHIPTSRRSPWPGGAELPKEYSHTLDPFVGLAAAAAVTDRLLLGTGICLVIERDPITLAKEVASVDHLSNGRFLFGIGGGWNREEMENHGTDPRQRWEILRERIEAMKAIWTNESAEYHGKYVDFDPIWSWPKPVQRPHPPIIVGGSGPTTFDRVLSYGDGWMPINGRGAPVADQIVELQRRAADQGRAPIPVSVFGAPPKAAALEDLAAVGVTRAVFWLPPADRDVVLPMLDEYALLV